MAVQLAIACGLTAPDAATISSKQHIDIFGDIRHSYCSGIWQAVDSNLAVAFDLTGSIRCGYSNHNGHSLTVAFGLQASGSAIAVSKQDLQIQV